MSARQQAPGPVSVLRGHRSDVQCVAFLQGSRLLASGDAEGEARIWDLDDMRTLHKQRLHDTNAGILQLEVAQLPESTLISQGRDGVVKCWQLDESGALSREPTQVLPTGAFSFCRLSLLHTLQASSATVQQGFDAAGGKHGEQCSPKEPDATADFLVTHNQLSHGLLYQQLHSGVPPAATTAAEPAAAGTCSAGGDASEPDLDEQDEEQLMLRRGTCAAASSSGRSACGTSSCSIRMAPADADEAGQAVGAAGPLLAMAASDPADIGVWEVGRCIKQVCVLAQRGQEQPKHGLCMALQLFQDASGSNTPHVLAGYEDGTLSLWDVRQPKQPLVAKQLHSESVMALAVSPDSRSGISGAADEKLVMLRLDAARGHLEAAKQLQLTKGGIADVAIRGDGRVAATAGWDGKVRLFHMKRREPLAVLRYHQAQVACVRYAPGSHVLVSGGRDGLLALWDVHPPAAATVPVEG